MLPVAIISSHVFIATGCIESWIAHPAKWSLQLLSQISNIIKDSTWRPLSVQLAHQQARWSSFTWNKIKRPFMIITSSLSFLGHCPPSSVIKMKSSESEKWKWSIHWNWSVLNVRMNALFEKLTVVVPVVIAQNWWYKFLFSGNFITEAMNMVLCSDAWLLTKGKKWQMEHLFLDLSTHKHISIAYTCYVQSYIFRTTFNQTVYRAKSSRKVY